MGICIILKGKAFQLNRGGFTLKKNCWEVENCGKEPGGEKIHEFGVCPAATETKLHGVHGGENAGRACWVVAGTFCHGEVQGEFASKMHNCTKCDFYIQVKQEEGSDFSMSASLLRKLG